MSKYTEFGAEVRKELLLRGRSVRWLAEEIGVSAPYLTDILKGNRKGTAVKVKVQEILNIESVKEMRF
ncbi:helix-turn-helix domain-containing protein [Geomicrobium sediminis]|uniref:Transcriptional regulator with XRE-family HTH domain n=1 Tax=Geomicrobium sediminis TaxID=1347788 RepID=A0ABS2P7V2_9BACL|nr:helix-turn-helix domain-containing protein [Geomicrobium sediminis]MBM7631135.1 transcriptional regulator with XRE-family HTH domain [Geomicrobium sediminis]